LRELADRDLLLRPHVDRPPLGLAPQARLDGRADRVGHIRERPRLRAVANHRERLTAEELAHEDRDDAPAVQPVESRTVDVEVAENDDGEAHPREGEAEVLARGFRRRVAPAVDLCRAEHAVRVLGTTQIDRWCYATSKAAGEHFCYAFERMGLPVVVLRYFNVYGPRLDRLD